MHLSEKQGGVSRFPRSMEEFCEVIEDCCLCDLGFKGNTFTWQQGNSLATIIKERLDRFLANIAWCSLFPEEMVFNLNIQNPDHGSILLKQALTRISVTKKWLLKFESYWLSDSGCKQVVKGAWKKRRLMSFNERIPSMRRLKQAEKRLSDFQAKVPDALILAQCDAVSQELNELQHFRESYWHIRVKANDLRDNVKNTKYFHHKASQIRKRNSIVGLFDDHNEEEVTQYFDEEDTNMILNTPISYWWPDDCLYWWLNPKGTYSVKSGYWLSKLGHLRDWYDESYDIERACWKTIWNMEGPPRLKHFVWRACKGALAVMERLYDRYIIPSMECKVCDSSCETIIHALLSCKYSNEIWARTNLNMLILDALNKLLSRAFDLASKQAKSAGLVDNVEPKANVVARGFVSLTEDYCVVNNDHRRVAGSRRGIISATQWLPPHQPFVKVNVDAHVGENRFGVFAVVNDHNGVVLVAAIKSIQANWKQIVVEASALLFGLQVALGMGLLFLKLFLRALRISFDGFVCSRVKRNGNEVAHYVAQMDVAVGFKRF
ncbi:hypothetical protein RDABS01_025650 [Bienertia sinuspersici]